MGSQEGTRIWEKKKGKSKRESPRRDQRAPKKNPPTVAMAPGSPRQQLPTDKQNQEQSQDRPESPTVPHQQAAETSRTDPVESTNIDAMAIDPPTHQEPAHRAQVKTPEPKTSNDRMNGHKENVDRSPSTPGHLAPFDWEEFEARYEQALAEANNQEKELLEEFDRLVKASSSIFGSVDVAYLHSCSTSTSGLPQHLSMITSGESRGCRPVNVTSRSPSKVWCRRKSTVSQISPIQEREFVC